MLRAVQENAATAADIRAWLNRVLDETGLSVTDWATKAGIARTTIARALKEEYPFVTSSRTLAKLASAAGVSAPDVGAAQPRVEALYLPVRYMVQAGHWLEVDNGAQDFPSAPRAVRPDPHFAEWPQWLELVVGDSVDREIPPGHFAHVVDAIEMGYAPQADDFVVVERRRDQGRLLERSIKQVVAHPGRIELWPRSHNPLWNKPLDLSAPGEGVEVEIVGLVIGAYRGLREGR